MNYKSTRNSSLNCTASQAIAQGISEEGGLFVPTSLPDFSSEIESLIGLDYKQRASKIMSLFLTDFTEEEISKSVNSAYDYAKFDGDIPAKVQKIDKNVSMLELWHGPTCAFKDMALQILPHLLTISLKKCGGDKKAVILVATSGDTGKAALEGFKNVDGTEIIVFYPSGGVSPMQLRQMNTQEGDNLTVCAVEGNFDDCQTGVKIIFTNDEVKTKLADNNLCFSSANSINWGRLLPQIVYYFSTYADLCDSKTIKYGDKINFVVPTGNFGNILAGYYAKEMGLPIGKLICASNSNNVLTDFINTGKYDKNRDFYTTISPSMDILVSSNLERLLYRLCGENSDKLTEWMNALNTKGDYTIDKAIADKIKAEFYAGKCDDKETVSTIADWYKKHDYLLDPHTAVAAKVYENYVAETGDSTHTVVVSTASPYKFSESVAEALNIENTGDEFALTEKLQEVSGMKVPAQITELQTKETRFDNLVDKSTIIDFVLKHLEVK